MACIQASKAETASKWWLVGFQFVNGPWMDLAEKFYCNLWTNPTLPSTNLNGNLQEFLVYFGKWFKGNICIDHDSQLLCLHMDWPSQPLAAYQDWKVRKLQEFQGEMSKQQFTTIESVFVVVPGKQQA